MRYPRGFVALLSILILSALLLAGVVVMGIEVYFARASLFEEESYRASRSAAYTCAHIAFHSLSVDQYRFENKDELPVQVFLKENVVCNVLEASTTPLGAGVVVQGRSRDSYYDVYVGAVRVSSTTPLYIESWEEY